MYRILCIATTLFAVSAFSQEIAITIDDAPAPDSNLFAGEERTQKLIESLKKSDVSDVLLFVKTNNITEHSKKRLEAYVDAGFHLGNHSHNHYSANRKDVDVYLSDIALAHDRLKSFGNLLPFYRYPFLHEGNDRKVRDRIRRFLKSMGYQSGYVTVDNYDWYMDKLLQQALADGREIDYEALKKAYVTILWESIKFYDEVAQQSLGRSPRHVLLLHENDMAALYIGDLISHIRSNGWVIISPEEAYKDPIASSVPDVLYNKQGRVAAIAKSKGWDTKFLRHESESEDFLDNYFKDNGVYK
ncbi:polysaccharide deacetylase family protein [Porticoccus sp. W117]|uniref:polysaccharide deacetylase family protein n=1 Tax=Porticoccus sp. W117 TaxID=3054777 RepID=UPI0025989670|nr:polysaccharide deacetylase family protein [Porticoccus sp. W117]MDM3871451.1 polysaccharide deacetylase family protein [Porticoccus sp. W117]